MPLSRDTLEETLKQMGITVETDGKHFVHAAPGRYAPQISTILTLDEDGSGVTIVSMLPDPVGEERRLVVCDLLNHVHGQSLWNVRFHLDDEGRVLAIGRVSLWGRPFNQVQFGDILFSLLVTMDRLYPCVEALVTENKSVSEAFGRFFLRKDET